MAYIKLINGKIIECQESEIDKVMLENKKAEIISEEDAHILLFIKISNKLAAKFANYKNLIDIGQDIFYMLFKVYREKGNYAKDKSFADNARIWWNIGRKNCYYLIRKYKCKTKKEDLTNFDEFIDSEKPQFVIMGKNDNYEFEHLSLCNAIIEYIHELAHSDKYADQQMGLFGIAKLNGLSDQQAGTVLEVGRERIYEIRRSLKQKLYKKFGDALC